ncbi:MAG: hypothetical protein PHR06_04370 [Candidatus Cloacimonetes bacterium]|nr:hypothetical protein [Candidatus Cloacimonadota bacterium]
MKIIKNIKPEPFSIFDETRKHLIHLSILVVAVFIYYLFVGSMGIKFPECSVDSLVNLPETFWNSLEYCGVPNIMSPATFSLIWINRILLLFGSIFNWRVVYVIFSAVGVYFMLYGAGMKPLTAFLGSFLFASSELMLSLLMADNADKIRALMFLPWIIWSLNYMKRKLDSLSLGFYTFFLSGQLMTGYFKGFLPTVFIILSFWLIYSFSNSTIYNWRKRFIFLMMIVAGILIALLTVSYPLFYSRSFHDLLIFDKTTPQINLLIINPFSLTLIILFTVRFVLRIHITEDNKEQLTGLFINMRNDNIVYKCTVFMIFALTVLFGLGIIERYSSFSNSFLLEEDILRFLYNFFILIIAVRFLSLIFDSYFISLKELVIGTGLLLLFYCGKLFFGFSQNTIFTPPLVILVLSSFIVGIMLYLNGKVSEKLVVFVICLIFLVNPLFFSENHNSSGLESDSFISEKSDIAKFFLQDKENFRILSITPPELTRRENYKDDEYLAKAEMIKGKFPTIDGKRGYRVGRYKEIMEATLKRKLELDFPFNWNVLSLTGVKYVIYKHSLRLNRLTFAFYDRKHHLTVHLNKRYLPKYRFADSLLVMGNKNVMLRMLNNPNFDPAEVTFVERPFSVEYPDSFRIDVLEENDNRKIFSLSTNKKSLFIMGENYFPFGWKAFLDGSSISIHPVNYFQRGVEIPTGKHNLEVVYQPDNLTLLIILNNVSLAIILFLIVFGIIRYFKTNYNGEKVLIIKT